MSWKLTWYERLHQNLEAHTWAAYCDEVVYAQEVQQDIWQQEQRWQNSSIVLELAPSMSGRDVFMYFGNWLALSTAPGRDCYWAEEQTFDKASGTIQEIIDDVPDGEWDVRLRGDIFFKVRGAVRIRDRVEQQARQYSKIYVALESALANQNYENSVLTVRRLHWTITDDYTVTDILCVVCVVITMYLRNHMYTLYVYSIQDIIYNL